MLGKSVCLSVCLCDSVSVCVCIHNYPNILDKASVVKSHNFLSSLTFHSTFSMIHIFLASIISVLGLHIHV